LRDLCGVKGIPKRLKQNSIRLRDSVCRGTLALGLITLALIANASPGFAIKNKSFVAPITTLPPDGTVANVDAMRVDYDPKTKIAVATGLVRMTYGPFTLVATRVEYNQVTGDFKANGSVELREPNGNVLQADQLAITEKFKAGFAAHMRALLTNDVIISADYVKRTSDGITVYENARYSVGKDCITKDGVPIWSIETDQTTHDEVTHNLYHVNPRFKIAGHTIASLPYWQQPDPTVKRRSGWLSPNVKIGDTYGVGAVTPYFWAIAPDRDLTFSPMLSTKQGLAGDVEWRQRTKSGQYNIRAYGAYQMDPSLPDDNQRWRGAVKTAGDFQINQDWKWGWDGTLVSDRNFLDNYDYDGREIAQSDVYATGLWDQTYVSAQLLNFQSLDNSVNDDVLPTALPYVLGEKIVPQAAFGGDLKFNWSVYSLRRNDSDTPFATVNHGTDQTRGTVEVEWKTQLISDMGVVVSPFAKLRSDIYVTNGVPDATVAGGYRDSETTTRVLPTAGVDMRFPFIASYDSGQSIISPVFQLISAADESDINKIGNEDAVTLNLDHTSLFLADRFTGLDRFEGGTRANLGLTYSFLGSGGNFVRASVGESVHLAGQNSFATGSGLDGTQSDLVGSVVVQPWNWLALSYEARVEEDLSQLNRQEATASLTFDSFSANVSYLNFGAEPAFGRISAEHWISTDARYQLSSYWYAFGGVGYDFSHDVLTRKTAGLEFDCDCMNLKLSYTGTDDAVTRATENKVMLSVEFATLGKSGVSAKF
jgi:LPS-assembly protein